MRSSSRSTGCTIDTARREVTRNGAAVELSALEFDLLVALARAPGRVLTRRQLLEQVWGWDFYGDERVVDVHIRSIRRALGDPADAPQLIGTVRGVGYRFLGVADVKRLRRLDVRLFGSYALVVVVVAAALVLTFAVRAPTLFAERIRRAGESGSTEAESHRAFAGALWSTLPIALVVSAVAAALVTAFVSRQILRPIAAVRRATGRLAAGRYDERVAEPAALELAALAGDVNRLAGHAATHRSPPHAADR